MRTNEEQPRNMQGWALSSFKHFSKVNIYPSRGGNHVGDNDGVALSSDWPRELYHATKTRDPSTLVILHAAASPSSVVG